jgi:hypothetical protein
VIILIGVVILATPGDNLGTLRRLAGFDDPPTAGPYRFVHTQPGTQVPVGYNPCQSIKVAVNPQGAPSNYSELVDTAIRHISEASGLRFQRVADTEDRNFHRGYAGTGPRPAVLVAWATTTEVPALEGNVIGVAASARMNLYQRQEYSTGMVALDRFDFMDFDMSTDRPYAQAILDHEFAHLVGLDHVHDEDELMNEENVGLTSFGPGDREGLARLGALDC